MKKVYRHIGYYNDFEDCQFLIEETPDFIVKYMEKGLGHFYRSEGESETDIENIDDESDAFMFKMTDNGQFLVRYQRGDSFQACKELQNAGWYIDVYHLTEVESDDQDDQIEEYCEHCGDYVDLPEEFKVHTCPNCGKYIVACTLCPFQPEEAKCATCPLSKQADILNKLKNCGVASTVQIFTQAFNNSDISIREHGFEITLEVSGVGMTVYTLAYNPKHDHCVLFRKYAGGNAHTFPGSVIEHSRYLCEALNSLSGERTTGNTPIHVRQLK